MGRDRRKKLTEVLSWLLGNDGDSLDWVAELAEARGIAPPEIMKNRPELQNELQFYWEAFDELSSEVNPNGAIPWSSIDRYAERYRVNFETFRYIIRAMEKVRREAFK